MIIRFAFIPLFLGNSGDQSPSIGGNCFFLLSKDVEWYIDVFKEMIFIFSLTFINCPSLSLYPYHPSSHSFTLSLIHECCGVDCDSSTAFVGRFCWFFNCVYWTISFCVLSLLFLECDVIWLFSKRTQLNVYVFFLAVFSFIKFVLPFSIHLLRPEAVGRTLGSPLIASYLFFIHYFLFI